MRKGLLATIALGAALCWASGAQAGNQIYEPLAASVQASLHASITDRSKVRDGFFANRMAAARWKTEMSRRLDARIPQFEARMRLLDAIHYEAVRAGLDPQLVLAIIQVESNFRRYAVSSAGARGLMQVMPFWAGLIGDGNDRRLFDMATNLRYGCVILRYYIDRENGDLFRALGRYNGSLGKPQYPGAVMAALHGPWRYKDDLKTALSSRG